MIRALSPLSSFFLSPLHMHLSVVTHCFIPSVLIICSPLFPTVLLHSIYSPSPSLHSLLSVLLCVSSGSSTLPADDLRFEEVWLWLISCSSRRSLSSRSFSSSTILGFLSGRGLTTSLWTSLYTLLGSGDSWVECFGFLASLDWLE